MLPRAFVDDLRRDAGACEAGSILTERLLSREIAEESRISLPRRPLSPARLRLGRFLAYVRRAGQEGVARQHLPD
jgi:hypothetical protein